MTQTRQYAEKFRDLLEDLHIVFLRTPLRVTLLGLGTFVACLVAVIATTISNSTTAQINDELMKLAPSRVSAQVKATTAGDGHVPQERVEMLRSIDGVTGVAWYKTTEAGAATPNLPWLVPQGTAVQHTVVGGDISVLDVRTARTPDEPVNSSGTFVGGAADDVQEVAAGAMLSVADTDTVVAGTVVESRFVPNLLTGVTTMHVGRHQPQGGATFLVQVTPGSADRLAPVIQSALSPAKPEAVSVTYPGDAASLRESISSSVQSIALLLALVLLVVAGVTVGIASFAKVVETQRLLALMRAAGASRASIITSISAEAVATGLVAAIVGTSLGTAGSLLVMSRHGAVELDLRVPIAAVILAVIVNGVSAAVPAFFVTRVDPAKALR